MYYDDGEDTAGVSNGVEVKKPAGLSWLSDVRQNKKEQLKEEKKRIALEMKGKLENRIVLLREQIEKRKRQKLNEVSIVFLTCVYTVQGLACIIFYS